MTVLPSKTIGYMHASTNWPLAEKRKTIGYMHACTVAEKEKQLGQVLSRLHMKEMEEISINYSGVGILSAAMYEG